MAATPKKTCFVMMPYGTRTDPETKKSIPFDDVYKHIFKPTLEGHLKLKVIREDEEARAGFIHRNMLKNILEADVAVVDISFSNPNVFYELGIRHALRRSVTVIVKEKEAKIPFDIQGMRIIQYGLGLKESDDAKRDLASFIRTGLEKKHDDSLVYDIFPDLQVSLKRTNK